MSGDIQLREVQESDLPIFFEYQQDPVANRMAAFPARDEKSFYEHWKKILADENNINRTILYKGQVAGNIACFPQDDDVSIGYWVGRQFWGKGIASTALCEFLGMIEKRPLTAHVVKHNKGSIRVLEKCGFQKAGENEEEFIMKLE